MTKPPTIVCVVGRSGSGKTTLIERVLPRLAQLGLRVATLKRTHHSVPFDTPSKDSWRHAQAGACQTALLTPHGLAFYDHAPSPSLDQVVACHFNGVELVIVEGGKREDFDKIEVLPRDGSEPVIPPNDAGLIAVVGDTPSDIPIPFYDRDDIEGVARFLAESVCGILFAEVAGG